MKNIYLDLTARLDEKEPIALATIIVVMGSSPQVPGASALFSSSGLVAGTLGGGWLEAAAQEKAMKALAEGKTRYCGFSLRADIIAEHGAICGGDLHILIDARPQDSIDAFQQLVRSLDRRERGALLTLIRGSASGYPSVFRYWMPGASRPKEPRGNANIPPEIACYANDLPRAAAGKQPDILLPPSDAPAKNTEEHLFVEPIAPSPPLVIVGAGHIGRALTHLGSLLNFEVTVIDDRPEHANKEMLPDADRIIVDTAERALAAFPKTPDSHFVIVTRGHLQDADALRQVIASDVHYIGMIGSKRKVALMREQFLQEGWSTAEQFDRVHAPIGVEINSETVEEIAISIAAELIRERHK